MPAIRLHHFHHAPLGIAALLFAAASARAQSEPPHRFPTLGATALSGRHYALPADFGGRANVLFVAFRREQQATVDTWTPSTRALVAAHPEVRSYELPTIGRGYRMARPFIDGGMRRGIPDPATRDATITLYLDTAAFRDSLGIAGDGTITVLLVDRAGTVRWRATGGWSAALGAGLQSAVEALLAEPTS